MASPLSSEFGGRVELVLQHAEDLEARYLGCFSEGERLFSSVVKVSVEGKVNHEQWRGEPAPTWLLDVTQSLLRTAWRQRTVGTPWPRRLTRWRKGSDES
ncbi:MAG: hypothetical protein SFV15_06160 [Polyangiaceae bacterium]|nr:hypothetical protein [Polyangiaceae bacterium]